MSSAKAMLGAILGRFLFRDAQVTEVASPASGFRRVSLAGDALRGARWSAGDKLQIFLPEVGTRAYTPLFWDCEAGRTALLIYVHGSSPGAAWARDLTAGSAVQLFGPRRSISVDGARSLVVFGDETSIGLSYALRRARPQRTVTTVLEVSSVAESEHALRALEHDATLVQRSESDAHLRAVADHVRAALNAQPDAELVLTGRARAIQSVRRELRAKATTKAYWSPGKVGLD